MKRFSLLLLLVLAVFSSKAQRADTLFVDVDGAKLFTILTSPVEAVNPPLAIIIAGSGPTDHNGNQPLMENNGLLYLSNELVSNGIATFRFDKRGIARSYYEGLREADLTIDLYGTDVEALIDFARKIGYKDIYLLGHSEGSLLGLLAANHREVKGFVSICGAGNPIDITLKKQLQSNLPPAFYNQSLDIIEKLKQGEHVDNVPLQLASLFRPSIQNYMISWLKLNPSELVKNLPCPVLVVQGSKDIQVAPEEGEALVSALPRRTLVTIENMNHILKTIEGDLTENINSYSNPSLPVNPKLVKTIVNFIRK